MHRNSLISLCMLLPSVGPSVVSASRCCALEMLLCVETVHCRLTQQRHPGQDLHSGLSCTTVVSHCCHSRSCKHAFYSGCGCRATCVHITTLGRHCLHGHSLALSLLRPGLELELNVMGFAFHVRTICMMVDACQTSGGGWLVLASWSL
jgi:hypothetical protein